MDYVFLLNELPGWSNETNTQLLPPSIGNRQQTIKQINMIKRILILFFILISSQTFARIGDNPNFWIISQNDYNERISKGKDVILMRHIVVHSNSFNSEKITEQINKRYTNPSILQQDYAVSMVEAISYNFNNVIELVVNDLNTFFNTQN